VPAPSPQKPAEGPSVFDHDDDLVRRGKQQWWHGEAEHLGGLQVEDQLKLGGLLHG
jgi:hypothetical protein